MKASTHAEVYRPFEGSLLERPRRPLVLAWSGIRLGFRKKLPAFLLFAPPVISALVSSVMVYLMYSMSENLGTEGGFQALQAQAALEELLGNVARNVASFVEVSAFFALLAMTWFGAGLIADDRRTGANLLYFSRPVTRVTYILGKWLGVAFFGVVTLLAPACLILLTAILASPDWSFLKEESSVILQTLAYSVAWISVVSTLVLGLSSMVQRRSIALVLTFGAVMVLHGLAEGAAEIFEIPGLRALSLFNDFNALAAELFTYRRLQPEDSILLMGLVGWILVPGAILWRQVRKMEVVG
ncbi:MAG: ABC transporter permease [Planctomycetes bacterium]|nr:ABC transporter permease [Planctomycetota bacterium]MDA0948109.1 ABC transporter permease subunit [Planctomycetota bacterium]